MLIFLDIDGVMVPAKSWSKPELLNDGFAAFSTKANNVLQSLISEGDTIILTTSHKANYTIEEWKAIFKNRGINVENIERLNENVDHLSRCEEIVNWANLNDIDGDFIILDDDKSLNGLPDYLKTNLILTSPMIGLTDDHYQQAVSLKNQFLQTA